MDIPKGLTPREKDIWKAGYLEAPYEFAYMKDGEYLVGSCGTKYKDVKAELASK